jgi:hypothetical protein
MRKSLEIAWTLASGEAAGLEMRKLGEGVLDDVPVDTGGLVSASAATEAARTAIMRSIRDSCSVPLSEAIDVQARHFADFSVTDFCKQGTIGAEYQRTMMV